MSSRRVTCPQCGNSLPPAPARGRPPTYCGTTCRRAAEFEIKRIQARLLSAERAEIKSRLDEVTYSYGRKDHSRETEFWQSEVVRIKAELRTALAGLAAENREG